MSLSGTQWIIVGAVGATVAVVIISGIIYAILRISLKKRQRRGIYSFNDNVMSTSDSDAVPLIDNNLQSDEDMFIARTYLRATSYNFEKELSSMNTETRTYFTISDSQNKQKRLLSVIDIGIGKFPQLPEKTSWKSLLKNLKHPLLNKIYDCDYIPEKGKAIVISDIPENTTLQDIASKKGALKTISEEDVLPTIFRYLLEALFGLERIGIILPGINMEQIFLDKNYHVKLNGIEDAFLDTSDSISSSITFSIDDPRQPHPHVIAFGCHLYRMVTGQEIGYRHWLSVCDEVQSVLEDRDNIPSEYASILRRIFNSNMDEYDATTQSLLNESLFNCVNINGSMIGATMPKLTTKFQNFTNEICAKRIIDVVPSVSQVTIESPNRTESTSSLNKSNTSSKQNEKKKKSKKSKKSSSNSKSDQASSKSPPPPSSSSSPSPSGGAPPPPPPPPSVEKLPKPQKGRGQLLSDIRSFSKGNLSSVE
eukprot:gb/GECH01001286.1/.p1 GENE.gb/GECH01001286.1/~~gb/GECH01001286.1/.p1  ORF type:complete len:480 (+),score=120.20 gb/GECH01001286.1/:1-1440(+)